MSFDRNASIAEFLNATAARQPIPGGGSVAALAGALAAAIGEMVLNYSVGRTDAERYTAQLTAALSEMSRARELLLQLMVEDQAAYAALSAARKSKDNTFPVALLACIRIPQSIAAAGVAILELCAQASPIANKHLLSDLAVSAELSMATVRCAVYNVRINLSEVKDTEERARLDAAASAVLSRGVSIITQVVPAIWRRAAQG